MRLVLLPMSESTTRHAKYQRQFSGSLYSMFDNAIETNHAMIDSLS